ncbi:hypothetical protein TWF106_004075 [Orbilia oligospora]|uniref:Major facilitator superfamily (MFS) profile domain-containing protein n=1 Tax=Orbilia oligospora TaxID=2813651 RepID=A0A6G1M785_ORBOL|nr:hypothetical protein TWF788_002890 [Orbilia oligospora]KAF3198950.1 hypothetical protein TWF106_004075 [Orbilia oligospora]KAF3205317.1 hypothetical protein TWF679_009333 [Orbilia oligospora]KAF3246645.1 hypothetical protein TWF192_006800 [Orbilia oligospora]
MTIGAFEVSKTRRKWQVALATIYCLLSAGVVFGYAAIKPVLIAEGVYRDRCTDDELDRDVRVCFGQELHLNFMFTCAAVATNVCALPVGTILDKYGPRVSGMLGAGFFAAGCLLFAFAWELPFDAYIPAYLFLALGGPFVFISSFQLSNTFPTSSGLILSLLTGAFDASSAVFLIYRLIYFASGETFWPKKFFLVYLIVPVFTFLSQVFVMPRESYKTVGELVHMVEEDQYHSSDEELPAEVRHSVQEERRASVASEIDLLLGPKGGERHQKRETAKKHISGVWGALHGKTAREQITSWWFVLITAFTVIQMTRINYFVATIRPQYTYLLGSYEDAVEINNFFDIALPMGGLVAVPFIGALLDRTSTTFIIGLLVATATAIGILGILPYKWAAYLNVILFVVYRPLYYTTVSDYAAKVFGFVTFGKVYGTIICLAGLFNFVQSGLDALTYTVFGKNPVPVNVILQVSAMVVGTALVAYISFQSKKMKRDELVREAESAEETAMPVHLGFGESSYTQ